MRASVDVECGKVCDMPPKVRRVANSDLATLFRAKERVPAPKAIQEFALFERLYRGIKTPSGAQIYLSEIANRSFLRLVKTVETYLPSCAIISSDEIYQACEIEIGRMYEHEEPIKEIAAFLAMVEDYFKSEINTYRFYSTIDGLYFTGVDQMRIGRLSLLIPDIAILEHCNSNEIMLNDTWKRMNHGLWVTVEITGSRKYAERRFFEDVRAACGLLAVSLTSSLERGCCGVRLIPSMGGRVRPSAATWFSIKTSTNDLSTSSSMRGFLPINIRDSDVKYLLASEWFVELTRIIQDENGSDVEKSVRRAIYWFFDAQADTSIEMQFVKFWSCIECFFSFDNSGQTTTKIKRGLTALLKLGNFGFSELDSWESLEREIDALYDLRSLAVHNANHSHVSEHHVIIASKWAAWTILEVSGLISKGYKTRAQIKEQTDRLSEIFRQRSSQSQS